MVAQGSYEVDLGKDHLHIPELCVFSLHLNGFSVSPALTVMVTLSYPKLARNGSLRHAVVFDAFTGAAEGSIPVV